MVKKGLKWSQGDMNKIKFLVETGFNTKVKMLMAEKRDPAKLSLLLTAMVSYGLLHIVDRDLVGGQYADTYAVNPKWDKFIAIMHHRYGDF